MHTKSIFSLLQKRGEIICVCFILASINLFKGVSQNLCWCSYSVLSASVPFPHLSNHLHICRNHGIRTATFPSLGCSCCKAAGSGEKRCIQSLAYFSKWKRWTRDVFEPDVTKEPEAWVKEERNLLVQLHYCALEEREGSNL